MGTFYHITLDNNSDEDFKSRIDSILIAINAEVSTYEKEATIVQFNQQSETSFKLLKNEEPARHFIANINRSLELYKKTNGAFDPTVMPLVQYWGFGTEKSAVSAVDSLAIDSLRQFVGMDKLTYSKNEEIAILKKINPSVQLDFSAIAKGYAVDEIARFLDQKGIKNYFVEIGGEVIVKGQSVRKNDWRVGVTVPKEDAKYADFKEVIPLRNKAMASSGNYRNFYDVNGKKYGHTINPKTGFPEMTTLLSASVIANDCMTADAYATACMVMGLEKAFAMADTTEEIEVLLIYGDEDGGLSIKHTSGFDNLLN